MEIRDILNVFLWVPVIYFGDLLMLLMYILLLLLFTGLNPVQIPEKILSCDGFGLRLCFQ